MKNIEIKETGLQCDAEGCEWKDETIKHEEYKDWLNKPCPVCGANVLTEQDFNNSELLHSTIDFINSLSEEELKALGDNPAFMQAIMASGVVENPEDLTVNEDGYVKATVSTHKTIKIKLESDEQGSETPVSES